MNNWNYRVIEFALPSGERMRAIHEVHYVDGKPSSYSERPASVGWDTDEGDGAPLATLTRMQTALDKPILTPTDFGLTDQPKSV